MQRDVLNPVLFAVRLALIAAVCLSCPLAGQRKSGGPVRTDALVRDYASASIGRPPEGVDPFYAKSVDAHGIKVMSSSKGKTPSFARTAYNPADM